MGGEARERNQTLFLAAKKEKKTKRKKKHKTKVWFSETASGLLLLLLPFPEEKGGSLSRIPFPFFLPEFPLGGDYKDFSGLVGFFSLKSR